MTVSSHHPHSRISIMRYSHSSWPLIGYFVSRVLDPAIRQGNTFQSFSYVQTRIRHRALVFPVEHLSYPAIFGS